MSGFLKDIELVQPTVAALEVQLSNRTADIKNFSSDVYIDGGKKDRDCCLCRYVQPAYIQVYVQNNWLKLTDISRKKKFSCRLVADITTICHHLEAVHAVSSLFPSSESSDCNTDVTHQGVYREWTKQTGFVSMLPKDALARCKKSVAHGPGQTHLDRHLQEHSPTGVVVKYTDEVFRNTAIKWLIATDQVCR